MAERRMFAKSIIESDLFLDMPISARLLYYDLGMRGDDDGFVNSPKRIMRITGAHDDDLKILIAKRFVIMFESGVIVIRHWKSHNYIRSDRYKPTIYREEKALLLENDNGHYELAPVDERLLVGIPNDNHVGDVREHRLGKGSIGKVREIENIKTISSEQSAEANTPSNKDVVQGTEPAKQAVITLPLNDNTQYPIYQEQVQEWAELYPAVNVIQQIRGMKGWLMSNPQKRKTKRGINGFINRWLSKAQDRGGDMVERGVNYGANSNRQQGNTTTQGDNGTTGSKYRPFGKLPGVRYGDEL